PGLGTEGFGAGSPPAASAAPTSPPPVPVAMSPPSSLPTTPSRHTSPNAAGASPPLSRGVGARAGLSLRGNRVVRWPRAAAAENGGTGAAGGMPSMGGGMTSSDNTLCDEIATRVAGTMRDMMREGFQEFMTLTRELVQADPDVQGAKRRKDTPPDENGGGSA
ncbi:unnamed protein product, partial [Closterium sp. Naga37s-1]